MTKRLVGLLVLAVLLASCGDDPALTSTTPTTPSVPAWAKVAPEQIAEAEKHGVPVAFENDLGMRFVLIPAGTFWMGSPEDEEGRHDDETRNEVTISRPYYVQTSEVTNQQYREWRPSHSSGAVDGHDLDGQRRPVASVDWGGARDFAQWLSTRDGRRYRLPTEAEWERACRARTQTRFHWGDGEYEAWFHANVCDPRAKKELRRWCTYTFHYDDRRPERHEDGHLVTAEVCSFHPNDWGLWDMHGNVWEWCADWYAQRPAGRSLVDPLGPLYGSLRILKGGAWYSMPERVRCGYSARERPDGRGPGFGFRLVSPLSAPGVGGR